METFTENTKVILIDKPEGDTPLETINTLKKNHEGLRDTRMAYAGRLDPAASGLLVILVGEECKNRDYYQSLDKSYEWDLVIGVRTDSLDALGIPIQVDAHERKEDVIIDIERSLEKFKGSYKQKYPNFSSYRVKSRPLFWWTKEGRLDEIEIPTKEVEIKELDLIGSRNMPITQITKYVEELTNKVVGDFRQQDIKARWNKLAEEHSRLELKVIRLKATVGSGTYIRSLSEDLAREAGYIGFAMHIRRTSVGDFSLESINNNK